MIALLGLALVTGRAKAAKQILLAFSRLVDGGMLPNNFPDAGGPPEYNTMDATLWYFEAARQYFAATRDSVTLKKLFPIFAKIVSAHVQGTRYNIHVDPADGLLYGGGPGVQLTWLDAKVGDWVVTPRTGKPVEINALWINALEIMVQLANIVGTSTDVYAELLQKAKLSFGKFWNAQRNCCFDVLDSPGIGGDAALRPNQIFTVSLNVELLPVEQQKAVVDVCASQLLTPFGLRSLAPHEPGYIGVYSGGPCQRDAAYHQGTVWGWLLGPFALAHYRVYKDRDAARRLLEPLVASIDSYGLGTLAEIFDGDAPHRPRGCIAQAWTVGEILRAWKELQSRPSA
jgi:predicted glycogen debranching enzyme